jgi:hypothetical protein
LAPVSGQQHLNGLDGLPFLEAELDLSTFFVGVDVFHGESDTAVEVIKNLSDSSGLGAG